MFKEVSLQLPWPPSVNQVWATTKRGNWYGTKIAKDYKAAVKYIVMQKNCQGSFPKSDNIEYNLFVYPPDNRRRDLDNLNKVVCDALQDAGVYDNDCQIKRIFMEMKPQEKPGTVIVILKSM